MLSMDDIKYIRRMHDVEGCSIREIMRRSGYHYETVKKYLDMEDFSNTPLPPKEVPSLLDPLKPIIDEWLENDLKAPRKQRHTAKRVYERLLNEYPSQIEVKLRTVQYYVSKKKKELYAEKSKGYIPLEHPAGEAQVDFCQFFYYDNSSILKEGRKLTVSFPQSNGAY
jgi:transposase